MENDIYFYDTDSLHGIASGELVKQGLKYFSDNRVIGVALENDRVVAQVEDEAAILILLLECNRRSIVCNLRLPRRFDDLRTCHSGAICLCRPICSY